MTWLVLIATITPTELQASMLAAMTAAGLPTSSWTKDGFWQNLINWFAFLLRTVYLVVRDVALNAFLPTASGPGLTDLAAGTFGTARRIETFATGTATLLNASGSALDEVAEAITFELMSDPTITYKNSAPVFALNGNSVVVPIVCDIAGTIGNAVAGVTIALTTTLTGVSLTSNSVVVGQDEQTDDDLRALAAKQSANLSEGVQDKFTWIVLNTNTDGSIATPNDGKTRLNINRTSVTNDSAIGTVTIVLASPAGPVDAGEYATAIEVLEQYVLANPGILDDYNATAVPLDLVVTIELRKGAPTDGVSDAVTEYVNAWFVSTDNGIEGDNGLLTLDELRLMIGRARPNIRRVTITTINAAPPADVALAFNEVATLNSFALTVVVEV